MRSAFLLLACSLLLPATALAEPSHWVAQPGGTMSCELLQPCTPGTAVDGGVGACPSGQWCDLHPGGIYACTSSSSGLVGEAVCCTPVDGPSTECPYRLDVPGHCVPFGDRGICVWPDGFAYCAEAGLVCEAKVFQCLVQPRSASSDIEAGDCDGDGIPNGDDPLPCDGAPSCAPLDAGVLDAALVDAAEADAGVADANVPGAEVDPEPIGPGFTGDGGCSLALPSRLDVAPIFLLGLGLLLASRRRRRPRR